MTDTRWWRYVERLIGDDTYKAAAQKAGFNQSAFSRWSRGASADPAFVVKLARAYGANVLEALVEAEFLTEEEAGLAGKKPLIDYRALRHATQQITDRQKELAKLLRETFTPELINQLAENEKFLDSLSDEEKAAAMRNELDVHDPDALAAWRETHPQDELASRRAAASRHDGTVRQWDDSVPHAADGSPEEALGREEWGEDPID